MTGLRILRSPAAIALLGAFAVTGCGGYQLDQARLAASPDGTFDAGLRDGYIGLSQGEFDEGDYQDSDVFADRALAVSAGNPPGPEEIAARQLPDDQLSALSGARDRLTSALNKGAAEQVPGPAAQAQVMFDCWMQEQEENFQPEDISRCRSGFETAMADVDAAMQPVAAVPAPEPEPTKFYTIFFDLDSDKLNAIGSRVVDEIAGDWTAGEGNLKLVGHADASGDQGYNQALSERRAKAVRAALEELGLASNKLADSGSGETDLLVPTADGVFEPKNRRVTVTVE